MPANRVHSLASNAGSQLVYYVMPSPQPKQAQRTQVPASTDSKSCPFCAETIKAAAIVCRFFNRELPKLSPLPYT
jgi:hypothetical protein